MRFSNKDRRRDILIFLKLGGSLITDKHKAHSPRLGVIHRLADEILASYQTHPDLKLVLGHGSGSFGHVPAKQYGTRAGVRTPEQWMGFSDVWHEARALNQIVIDAFHQKGLPVIAFPPSAAITTDQGRILIWNLDPIHSTLETGLIPLVYGDVVFDRSTGGTILSTEDLFHYLARDLAPDRILLAGIETGVWSDYPNDQVLLSTITPDKFSEIKQSLQGSAAVDVTGGMLQKVEEMLPLVQELPALKVSIFSGNQPGTLYETLCGAFPGTTICIE